MPLSKKQFEFFKKQLDCIFDYNPNVSCNISAIRMMLLHGNDANLIQYLNAKYSEAEKVINHVDEKATPEQINKRANALTFLGFCKEYLARHLDHSVSTSPKQAHQYIDEAVKLNQPDAMWIVATMYDYTHRREVLLAIPLLDKAIILGNTRAMCHRARIYFYQGDFDNACILCERAIALGNSDAMQLLAQHFITQNPDDNANAIELLERAIALNNISAMVERGKMHEHTSPAKAIALYEGAIYFFDVNGSHWSVEAMGRCGSLWGSIDLHFYIGHRDKPKIIIEVIDLLWNDLLSNNILQNKGNTSSYDEYFSKYTRKALQEYRHLLATKLRTLTNLAQLKSVLQPGHIIRTLLNNGDGFMRSFALTQTKELTQVQAHIRYLQQQRAAFCLGRLRCKPGQEPAINKHFFASKLYDRNVVGGILSFLHDADANNPSEKVEILDNGNSSNKTDKKASSALNVNPANGTATAVQSASVSTIFDRDDKDSKHLPTPYPVAIEDTKSGAGAPALPFSGLRSMTISTQHATTHMQQPQSTKSPQVQKLENYLDETGSVRPDEQGYFNVNYENPEFTIR